MAVTPIIQLTTKPFLGAQIQPSLKALAPKIAETVSVINTIQTGSLVLDGIKLDSGSQSGSNVPTINAVSGTITTAVLTTSSLGVQVITLTNNKITATSKVFVSIKSYVGAGLPLIYQAKPYANGSVDISIYNTGTVSLSLAIDLVFIVIN